jgi:ribosomal protein L37AE/L43A
MAYAGIDYGLGRTNVDVETGIRFGVISSHTIGQIWYDEAEADYGDPHCPKCGNAAIAIPSHGENLPNGGGVAIHVETPEAYEEYDIDRGSCGDYACEQCEYLFDGDRAFPEEAIGYSYAQDGYKLTDCLDSDVMVLRSEFFTYAQYCSPCVPGAGNLNTELIPAAFKVGGVIQYHALAQEAGFPRVYCLGHDWFEGGKAPYRVFRVDDGTEVSPEEA